MSGGLAYSAPVLLYTKPSSSNSRILSRKNFSCGGAYLRADIRNGFGTVAQLDDKGLHIRRRVCAKLEPESILALYHQLSQTLYTNSRHGCLLSARDKTFDSVRQFVWDTLPYLYIMVFYWVIIGKVIIEKCLLIETRKLYVEL
jgi:hypothetical protein